MNAKRLFVALTILLRAEPCFAGGADDPMRALPPEKCTLAWKNAGGRLFAGSGEST